MTNRYMPETKIHRVVELPKEEIKAVDAGTPCHTGIAMAVRIAGEDVIVIAKSLPKLNIVFNYIEANLRGGKAELMATLRTSACPKVIVAALDHRVHLDDDL